MKSKLVSKHSVDKSFDSSYWFFDSCLFSFLLWSNFWVFESSIQDSNDFSEFSFNDFHCFLKKVINSFVYLISKSNQVYSCISFSVFVPSRCLPVKNPISPEVITRTISLNVTQSVLSYIVVTVVAKIINASSKAIGTIVGILILVE